MTGNEPTSRPAELVTFVDEHGSGSRANRFLLSAIAFQRTKQLREGATARVARASHKATYLAVLEVLANTISWSRE